MTDAVRIAALEAENLALRTQLAEQQASLADALAAVSANGTDAPPDADAQQARQDMEQFAFVASHDLKEPLRIVANYLGLLRRRYGQQLDDSAHDYLNTALDATVRMRQLIDNLLEFSKAQALDAEVQSLRPALDSALQNLGQLIAENDAEIIIGTLPQAYVDHVQIARVFQNLIANALKYRSPERPVVKISAQRESDHWSIQIQDNGMGIAEQYQTRIFQMFSRLHARDEIEGSGIGLATCQRIVQRHGGEISVSSEVGRGSCFRFSLPISQDTADAVAA